MITLKTLKPIKDTTINKLRHKNEEFQVSKKRYDEMISSLKNQFSIYFELIAIEKQNADTKPKSKRK
jgi:hypothetical protein